jgi:propanediol utilization protein
MLDDTPGITLKVGDKSYKLDNGVIRAERHVHVPTKNEEKLGLHERDKVLLHANGKTFDANVKVSDNGYFEVHIDKDEALEYGLKNGDEIELEVCGK